MDENTRDFARYLRQNMSLPEMLIWSRIRGRHLGVPRFRRNHAIGPYFADFYCAKAMLVIEIDGASHSQGDQPERDEVRDTFMRDRGYEVIRLCAADVLREPDAIVEGLLSLACERVLQRRRGR